MKFIPNPSLKFPDAQMEAEFASIKAQTVISDHTATVNFMVIMNILISISGIILNDFNAVYTAVGTSAGFIILYIFRYKCKKYIHILTLFAFFLFITGRLIIVNAYYNKANRGTFILIGFSISSMQYIVISQVHRIQFKAMGMLIACGIRYGILFGVIDINSFELFTVLRQIAIDLLMIYTFYSQERSERKVFSDYYHSKEELLKFKELLAHSLPMSVLILEHETLTPLFSNQTFSTSFDRYKPEPSTQNTSSTFPPVATSYDDAKPYASNLVVDTTTIRKTGDAKTSTFSTGWNQGHQDKAPNLDIAIKKLIQRKALEADSISLTASSASPRDSKSFEVILKRIKWNQTDAIATIFNDITYQENLISLKVANTNKDKIISTVSHELRTPLHGILSLLESTEKKVKDVEILENLSLCKDNAYLLWSLVNSIVDLHQISTGNLRLNIIKTDLNKTFRHVKTLFEFPCKQKSLDLVIRISESLSPFLKTDENRLKQILVNLTSNAVKFTSKGTIIIEATQDLLETDSVQISVTDTGLGIKEEEKPNLCRMYRKLDNGESVSKNGAGIGLTIANALALVLYGNRDDKKGEGIELVSEYGKGSQFSFKISKDLNRKRVLTEKSPENDVKGLEKQHQIFDAPEESFLQTPLRPKHQKDNGEDADSCKSNYCLEESDLAISIEPQVTIHPKLKRFNTQDISFHTKISHYKALHRELQSEEAIKGFLSPAPHKSIQERTLGQAFEQDKSTQIQSDIHQLPQKDFIVVVDDTPLNLLVAEHLVKNIGFSVKTAMGGLESIELIKSLINEGKKIKAILMDCQMPVMDGYETTRVLKQMMDKREIPSIPILAWTANNSDEDVKKCYECGMVGHLVKPTSQQTLIEALSHLKCRCSDEHILSELFITSLNVYEVFVYTSKRNNFDS